ncbi:hypothetical protein [Sphaerochaeta sp. PS]|uniref:hypothetical protein n=1 Tax=Sphaerochaeta sp. PS TaxID=3076336 RepID=UPI0028A4DEA2|nr:hypothetical protein [Sphaerochaeta sp. PS]MDT4761938.1 hypothetical protein [Sphaerochaeta sp. PS]
MKNFKLVLITLTLVLLVAAPLVAADYSPGNVAYKQTGAPFMGINTRVLGMGGAGLGVKGYYDSFLLNPANLAGSNFKLSIPAITLTAYNPQSILESGSIDKFVDGDTVGGAQRLFNTITQGQGDLLTTDASVVLSVGGFGIAIETQERIMTYLEDSDSTNTNLIAQITAAATVGFGFNIALVPDKISIDLGVTGKGVYKTYLKGQTVSSIINLLMDESSDPADKFLNGVPLAAGYAIPVTAGANVNFPFGLSLSAVGRNFNGNYSMEVFPSANTWAEKVLGSSFTDNNPTGNESGTFEYDDGWKLDAGLTWAPKIGSLIKPIIAVDVIDVMSLAGLEDDALTRGFYSQTRLGASVRLLSFLDVRYGLNQGYQSIGVGLDLLVFHLDAAYYQLEYGDNLGDKPIDALSLRFSLLSR